MYARADGVWKLEAASAAAIYAGGWGGPPAGMELRGCAKRRYRFVVEDGFTAQGYTDAALRVYGPVGSSVRELLTVPVESDDPDGSTKLSAAVRFVPRATRLPFFDAEVMTVRQKCANGHCSIMREETVYRYRDGEYAELQGSVIRPGKAKEK